MTDYQTELDAALAAADEAARYARAEYAAFEPIPNAPASITTHVDRGCQELILRALRARFPGDAVKAEEATPAADDAPTGGRRLWIVDPIDGTRGFARKNGEFSVMIALAVDGAPVVGVVGEPVPDRVTYAVAGRGCWAKDAGAEPVRCRVAPHADLAAATLAQSHSRPGYVSFASKILSPGRIRETYSAGIKLALVARGEADLYVNDYAGFHDWDICAGHILVEEAGGRVSEFGGGPIVYGSVQPVRRGLAATNGALHDEVVRRIRESLA